MSNEFAGKGRKRPLLNIPIELIDLDAENPRLAKEGKDNSQNELIQNLYAYDLEEIALSMAENGYFDEEPIVVVPTNLPEDFEYSENPQDLEQIQSDLQKLTNSGEIKFTVIEGNRRVATIKLLLDVELRRTIRISDSFPFPKNDEVSSDLRKIPAIFYKQREEVYPYLGIRHIVGPKKWDFYPRVVYISRRIEKYKSEGYGYEDSIKFVQKQSADRTDSIIKQYLYYRISQIIESELDFDVRTVISDFSLLQVAIGSPGIRKFIGLGEDARYYKNLDFDQRVLPGNKLEELEIVLTWIFGNKRKNIRPVFTDSRNISRLGKILYSDDATKYLLETADFTGAYERSDGEKDFLINQITGATKNLRKALSFAFEHKTDDIRLLIDECLKIAEELKKVVNS